MSFAGRSVSVVTDLSRDEQLFLYQKTQQLKLAIKSNQDLKDFKISDEDVAVYLLFMEDSTRTKESFRNAAKFHGVKVNDFDCKSSSFNKKESVTDTIKMLVGYSNKRSVFVLRTKMEGVCGWLSSTISNFTDKMDLPKACFLNAGDGRHEHPTQEFLDEFSFLEQLEWNRESIHLALVGDLFHGRTVHSKVDGLRIFNSVNVDLVAPDDIGMPEDYTKKMIEFGFNVRKFSSIQEYLDQPNVAKIWYFTRLQLERMGDKILMKEHQLRSAVTFKEDWIPLVPKDTKFYHPLPRHSQYPTIPSFLDSTPLNNWDRQAMNGYFTRITLLSMVCGKIGSDFTGQLYSPPQFTGQFVEELQLSSSAPKAKKEIVVGIKPIEDGIVIDHIGSGKPISEIWDQIEKIHTIMKLNVVSSHGVFASNSKPGVHKGIISLPGQENWTIPELKRLAAIAPGCILNIIRGQIVKQKFKLNMPPRIYNFRDIFCKNPDCVSNPNYHESVVPEFYRLPTSDSIFVCHYCDRQHQYQEIWQHQ